MGIKKEEFKLNAKPFKKLQKIRQEKVKHKKLKQSMSNNQNAHF